MHRKVEQEEKDVIRDLWWDVADAENDLAASRTEAEYILNQARHEFNEAVSTLKRSLGVSPSTNIDALIWSNDDAVSEEEE